MHVTKSMQVMLVNYAIMQFMPFMQIMQIKQVMKMKILQVLQVDYKGPAFKELLCSCFCRIAQSIMNLWQVMGGKILHVSHIF